LAVMLRQCCVRLAFRKVAGIKNRLVGLLV